MNFNPFTSKNYTPYFSQYPRQLYPFDRVVGRDEQMGLLDYLLVAPFIFKLLYSASKNITPLRVLFGIFTAPFAVAKFAIFIATSPISLLVWFITEKVKSNKARRAADRKQSPVTIEINQLMVKDKDPSKLSKPLSQVNELFDKDHSHYSIKMNNNNELVLNRFPSGQHVATFDKSYDNVSRIKTLMGIKENRVQFFMHNAGNHIFDFNVFDWITAQATSHFNLLRTMLLGAQDAREPNPKNTTSFASIPKDVRNIILGKVIAQESVDSFSTNEHGDQVESNNQFFNLFTPNERLEAQAEFVKQSTARPQN